MKISMETDWIAACIIAAFIPGCLPANILALVPHVSKSHHILYQPMFQELAARGHNLTVIVGIKHLKQPLENYTEIVLPKVLLFNKGFKDEMSNLFQSTSRITTQLASTILVLGQVVCNDTLGNKEVQRMLRSEQKFDLIIAQVALGVECFVGLGHRYKAPVVGLSTFPGKETVEAYIGNPNPAAFLPNWLTPFTDRMTLLQRAWNAFMIARQLYHVYVHHLPVQEKLMNAHIPSEDAMPAILDLLANVSLVLHNSQIGMTYARPYNPNVIEVGGMHIPTKRTPLPQDLQRFMDDAKAGVVFFSLGTLVPSHLMPEQVKMAFLRVFGELKQQVLWKTDADSFPELPNNVRLVKWAPQHDILAHANCKAFISHGGMLSVTEAIHFGVPLLGIPFYGDQPMNLAFVEARGVGKKMGFDEITYESLHSALNEILNNQTYYDRMQEQSAIFHDHPLPPLEKAIYWVEYVLRHRGAPHLQTATAHLSWTEYFLLDVFSVLLLAAVLLLSVAAWILASLRSALRSALRSYSNKHHAD